MLKRLYLLVTLTVVTVFSFAQQAINGIWEGKFLSNTGDLGAPKLVVEIYDAKDSTFSGITHLYYQGNKYEHYKMIGWYNKKDSLLVFREAVTIAVDLGIYGNCLGTYMTSLSRSKKDLFLQGYWVPNKPGCTTYSLVWLQKQPPPETTLAKEKPVTKQPSATEVKPVVPQDKPLQKQTGPATVNVPVIQTPETPVIKNKILPLPEKIAQRETDVQSLIEIAAADKDSIRVDIYDNGEIDGDSVSLFFGNELLVNKKKITASPISFFVSLDKKINPIAHLRLVAESLGSIPPCTALMIVTTKSKRYEVRLSSSFKKNATVELFLKE
ncbi:MAG: hypothetical protein U0V75_08420 [Ferruginibacter sp.]